MPNPLLRGGQGHAAHDSLDSYYGLIVVALLLLAAIAWASYPLARHPVLLGGHTAFTGGVSRFVGAD